MERYFFVLSQTASFIYNTTDFITYDGSFINHLFIRETVSKMNNNYPIDLIVVINIFEFKSKSDYENFIGR